MYYDPQILDHDAQILENVLCKSPFIVELRSRSSQGSVQLSSCRYNTYQLVLIIAFEPEFLQLHARDVLDYNQS